MAVSHDNHLVCATSTQPFYLYWGDACILQPMGQHGAPSDQGHGWRMDSSTLDGDLGSIVQDAHSFKIFYNTLVATLCIMYLFIWWVYCVST